MRSQTISASTARSGRSARCGTARYTGRALRALHAEAKADCLRELAEREDLDLAECTAYSDSHTDLPFLEAVGHPVVVNPDRELRRIAARARLAGSRVRRARVPARSQARVPPAFVAAGRGRPRPPARAGRLVDADEASRPPVGRSASAEDDARRLFGALRRTPSARGKQSHGYSRIEWLETLEGYDPAAQPELLEDEPGLPALARARGDRLSRPRRGRARPARATAGARRDSSSASGRSRRGCSATTCAGSPTAGSSRVAHGDLAGAPRAPRRRADAGGHEPARDRRSRARSASRSSSTSRWGASRAATSSRGSRTGGRPRPLRRRAGAQGVRARASACSCSSRRSCGTRGTAPCSSSRSPRPIRFRRFASWRPASAYRATASGGKRGSSRIDGEVVVRRRVPRGTARSRRSRRSEIVERRVRLADERLDAREVVEQGRARGRLEASRASPLGLVVTGRRSMCGSAAKTYSHAEIS